MATKKTAKAAPKRAAPAAGRAAATAVKKPKGTASIGQGFVGVAAERVWDAFVDPGARTAATGAAATGEVQVGSPWTALDGEVRGEWVELERPGRIVSTFRRASWPSSVGDARLDIVIGPARDGGVDLDLTQHGVHPPGASSSYATGQWWSSEVLGPLRRWLASAGEPAAPRLEQTGGLLDRLSGSTAQSRALGLVELRGEALAGGVAGDDAVRIARGLLPIVGQPEHPALPGALVLLADLLVCGDHRAWAMRGYDVRGAFFDEAPPDRPARAIYELIAACAPQLLRLLGSSSPAVRAAVGVVLAFLSRDAGQVEPILVRHLGQETDPIAIGSLAIATAHQIVYAADPQAREELERHQPKDPVGRTGVAIARVILAPAGAPPWVDEQILFAMRSLRDAVPSFGWFEGEVADLACVAANRRAVARGDVDLAERFATAAEGLDASIHAVGALLEIAFPEERATPIKRADLDERQGEVVRFVAASPDVDRLGPTLRRLGLPATEKGLRRLVAKSSS